MEETAQPIYANEVDHLRELFNERRQELNELMVNKLAPVLSKAVLDRGKEMKDSRTIYNVCWKWWRNMGRPAMLTMAGELFQEYDDLLTVKAYCQMTEANRKGYCFPEMISLMLEQIDYWTQDADTIIDLAYDYLAGNFDPDEVQEARKKESETTTEADSAEGEVG